ncbi:MAG TPA: hypothetical protein HA257_10115 [Candidatus Methanoperedenaceae archaeon]|nr:hypothetical protein [Candidatus Methanoperedenaceae archaeon]
MRCIADRMLGRLARWLRLLGNDTLGSAPDEDDDMLLARALSEKRVLLTRDGHLANRAKKAGADVYLVKSTDIEQQLGEVCSHFGLDIRAVMDRCTLCNSMLRAAAPSEARDYVPAGIKELWVCDTCGQVYWEGSHMDNIMSRVERLRAKSHI